MRHLALNYGEVSIRVSVNKSVISIRCFSIVIIISKILLIPIPINDLYLAVKD